MDEWSIGFDTLDADMDKGADDESFRRIKEVRLWEYSPVTWGANQATITTSVKDNDRGDEAPLVELSVEHLQDEAEPSTTLTSCKAELRISIGKRKIDLTKREEKDNG